MLESRLDMLNNNPYENVPKERMTAIAEAIANEDSGAIYNMFSQTAKDNRISEDELKNLIDFLKADIETIYDVRSIGEYEENNYGVKKIEIIYGASISVDGKIYMIDIGECVRDDTAEQLVGLTWLVVFPADSEGFPDVPDTGVYVIEQ